MSTQVDRQTGYTNRDIWGPEDRADRLDETDIRAAFAADLQRMGLWPEPNGSGEALQSDGDPGPYSAAGMCAPTVAKPTAEALARYLTVFAWQTWCVEVPRLLHEWEAAGLPTTGPLRDAFVHASSAATSQYAAAYLLRQVGDSLSPAEWDDVSLPYEGWVQHAIDHLTEWMHEWGIDADSRERLLATGQREAAMV